MDIRRWWPHILIGLVVAIAVIASAFIYQTTPNFSRAVDLLTVTFSLLTLIVVVLIHVSTSVEQQAMHRDMFREQQAMRRTQTRPQVLAYFARVRDQDRVRANHVDYQALRWWSRPRCAVRV